MFHSNTLGQKFLGVQWSHCNEISNSTFQSFALMQRLLCTPQNYFPNASLTNVEGELHVFAQSVEFGTNDYLPDGHKD